MYNTQFFIPIPNLQIILSCDLPLSIYSSSTYNFMIFISTGNSVSVELNYLEDSGTTLTWCDGYYKMQFFILIPNLQIILSCDLPLSI